MESWYKQKIVGVIIQPDSRVYRKFDSKKFENFLLGKTLLASECHGKQMLFTFSEMIFLGIHLGMTGDLELKPKNYQKEKHDAIVIQQAKHCLVFRIRDNSADYEFIQEKLIPIGGQIFHLRS